MTGKTRFLLGLMALALAVVPSLFAQEPPPPAEPLPARIQVYFAPKPAGDSDGMDVHIVKFFGKAKKTIHGAFYEIREMKFVEALIAAKQRGVDVKLLVDNASYYYRSDDGSLDTHHRNPFVRKLLDAGIEVRQDQNRSALMHNKFCVVDGRHVWSGSVNLTDTYATNCNNAVEIESPRMAEIFEREFDKKFTKQLFGRNAPSYAQEQRATIEGIPMEVLYAPEDDPMSRILVLLNAAKKSVHFMQFAFTEEKVTTILLTKFKAGVVVGGIFDHRLYRSTGPYGDFSTLLRGGVPVQLYAGPGLFHHKVFIIDAGTPRATVITGSQNSSANGNNTNDENVLILRDRRIADLYMAEYHKRLKESSQVTAESLYDKDPIVGSSIPSLKVALTANSVDVKRIKVEYPARWPVVPGETANIGVWRNGKAITRTCGLEFYPKGFYINNAGMTPTGPNSLVEIHFRRLKVPDIAGVYNLYVSIADGTNPSDLKPCRVQPTIRVVADASDAGGGNDDGESLPRAVDAPLPAVTVQVERDAPVQVADEAETRDAFDADLAEDADDGKLTNAERHVEQLERLARSGKRSAVNVRSRNVRRALRAIDEESPLHPKAQELLSRLEAAQ